MVFNCSTTYQARCEISVRSLGKSGKRTKTQIMANYSKPSLLSLNSFLEKIIFDLQIGRPRVHHVQISNRSDYSIATEIMLKHIKDSKV